MSFFGSPEQSRPMRAMVNAFEWEQTPLGPRADWPPELVTATLQILDSHFPMALAWGPDLITIYNDAFRPILGNKDEALGRPFSEVWEEAWDDLEPIADKALAGQATFIENHPLEILRSDEPETAYFTFCYSPLRLSDGTVAGFLNTVMETTQTVQTQADSKLVGEELAHRLKNSLAIVQAIASQTLRHHAEPEALDAFEKRLDALAHAHTVLVAQSWSAGSMQSTVASTLAPHVPMERVRIAGADIAVGSRTAMALSMMVHELATNAAKFGAMSAETGRIEIAWEPDGHDFRFTWREVDGPAVRMPERTGFGSRLVVRGLGPRSAGKQDFRPDGLHFEIRVPRDDLLH